MSVYSHLFSLALRTKDKLKGNGIYPLYDQLLKEQYLPIDELQQLQNTRLQKVMVRAKEASTFYQQRFSDVGIDDPEHFDIGNLNTIPMLTRSDLQEHAQDILTVPPASAVANSTGGSTGEPVVFYQSKDYTLWSEAFHLVSLSWMNIRTGDRTGVFWGADRDLSNLSASDKLYFRMYRIRQLNSFSMSEEQIDSFLSELDQFKPKYIYGYASSLYEVAKRINNGRNIHFRPRAIRSSAEVLFDYQRQEIEKAFQTKVFNFYGSREINNLAGECSEHHGLHILASGRIIEIVDENGRLVNEGETGYIVVTDLTNIAFPFIRYQIGDMGQLSSRRCKCGRTYPMLENITGRSSDMIVVNGQIIHGEYFTHLFYHQPDVKQFQLIQEAEQELKLLIVSEKRDIDTNAIREQILEKVGAGVLLTIETVDKIPPTVSGKHRFTICKLKR